MVLSVSFVESLPEDGDWHVHHLAYDSGGFGFHVRVSMSSDRIKLSELVLPEMRGKSEAEQDDAVQPATAVDSKAEGRAKP